MSLEEYCDIDFITDNVKEMIVNMLENKIDYVLLDEYIAYKNDLIDDREFFGEDHNIAGVKFDKGIDVGIHLAYNNIITKLTGVDKLKELTDGDY